MLPALNGKRSQPGVATLGFVGGKNVLPGFGGQSLFLDLVAKVCYLHLVANVAKFLVVLSEGAAPQDL